MKIGTGALAFLFLFRFIGLRKIGKFPTINRGEARTSVGLNPGEDVLGNVSFQVSFLALIQLVRFLRELQLVTDQGFGYWHCSFR